MKLARLDWQKLKDKAVEVERHPPRWLLYLMGGAIILFPIFVRALTP